MKCTRRDLGLLIPSVIAAGATGLHAQQAPPAAAGTSVEALPVIRTTVYKYDELPVTANGQNRQRRMFTAKTHTGFKIESHQSEIAPGEVNHGPHRHLREEMMLIREGVMELTIEGKPYRLGPGDVGVIGSNELHNAKNVGTTRATYFIVNIGRDDV
jgi:quercetin dioxygenase-like cupin family protein